MIETVLFVLCATVPSHMLAFAQYWEYPWRSKKAALVLLCLNVLLKTMAVCLFSQCGENIRAIEMLFALLGFMVYVFFVRTSVFKLIFTFILVLDYVLIVRGISVFASIHFFTVEPVSWQSSVLCTALYVVSMPWVLRYFWRNAQIAFETKAQKIWRTVWLVPALMTVIVLLFTNAYTQNTSDSIRAFYARISLLVFVLVVCSSLLSGLRMVHHQVLLEEQARLGKQILAFQRDQYAKLQEHMEDVRRARHDLRQHQNVIRSFLDSGRVEELRAYLQKELEEQPTGQTVRYCKNDALDALVRFYAGKIAQANIRLEVDMDLPEVLFVPEPDACVVLGNLLENALDACRGQADAFILIVARSTGQRAFTLIVDNTAPVPPVQQNNGAFLSSKHIGEGIGTQSVQYIAARYGGMADLRWENGTFHASVFFNPPAEAEGEPARQE